MKPIAIIHNDYTSKFGIPRQSGLVGEIVSKIVFEKEFRVPEALRGLEQFSHLWLLWEFSEAKREKWSPTVRPPRLGGNKRMGVFATRSPFRPNPIGLSAVKLEKIVEQKGEGLVLLVSGADLLDGTPIYDIKPYIPLSDCIPDASEGYTEETKLHSLKVEFPNELLDKIPNDKRTALIKILEGDPRPSYIDDPERVFGVGFANVDVKFTVRDNVLTVVGVEKI